MEKVNCSGLFSVTYVVIPQKPLIHPVNDENVFPVYVIISSSICNNPYESGNPSVPVSEEDKST